MRPDHNLVACRLVVFRLVVCLALALTIVVAGWHAAVAAELPIPPRLTPKESSKQSKEQSNKESKDFSIQAGPPNCSRWTDDCVNCTRGTGGASPTCSNIGFACQPKAIRCLSAQ